MKTIQISLITLAGFFMYACGGGGETTETTSENENTETTEASSDDSQESSSGGESMRRYAIKSGVIEYKVSGIQTGTETIYFDDWGMKEAKYSKTELKMAGISQKVDQITYIDGEWNYTYDVAQNTGTKLKNPLFDMLAKNMDEKDMKALGEKMMKGMGGEKIGQEEVLGKTCDVWEIKQFKSKTWVWKNIPLKTESKMMQILTIEATNFEENASVAADKLSPPKDVEFKDMTEMMKNVPGLSEDN